LGSPANQNFAALLSNCEKSRPYNWGFGETGGRGKLPVSLAHIGVLDTFARSAKEACEIDDKKEIKRRRHKVFIGNPAGSWRALQERHPEVQAESEALATCWGDRSFAGRMSFNNTD
jgi:hypothetical protein